MNSQKAQIVGMRRMMKRKTWMVMREEVLVLK